MVLIRLSFIILFAFCAGVAYSEPLLLSVSYVQTSLSSTVPSEEIMNRLVKGVEPEGSSYVKAATFEIPGEGGSLRQIEERIRATEYPDKPGRIRADGFAQPTEDGRWHLTLNLRAQAPAVPFDFHEATGDEGNARRARGSRDPEKHFSIDTEIKMEIGVPLIITGDIETHDGQTVCHYMKATLLKAPSIQERMDRSGKGDE